jgi:hypothetical protein
MIILYILYKIIGFLYILALILVGILIIKNKKIWGDELKASYIVVIGLIFFQSLVGYFIGKEYLLNKHLEGYWNYTGSKGTWVRLKLDTDEKTYTIWSATPRSGKWSSPIKGKYIFDKDRYSDNGKEFYKIVFPNTGLLSAALLAIDDEKDSSPLLKFSSGYSFALTSGDEENPWD